MKNLQADHNMRLLITRPEEDAAPLADALRQLGHEPVVEPLLHIDYIDALEFELDGITGVLITSATGIRALARVSGDRRVPVFAVGQASGAAARELGYRTVYIADGDVNALARMVLEQLGDDGGIFFHAAGSTLAGDLKGMLESQGISVFRTALYDARKTEELTASTAERIARAEIDGVLLYSPRTAETFAELIARAGLTNACTRIVAYCLSQAVADRVSHLPWRDMQVAAQPTQADMLSLIS